MVSSSSSMLRFFFADTSTNIFCPPHSSGIIECSVSSCLTLSGLAPGLSILLTATTIGTSAAFAWFIASIVCGITPSSAATTRTTTSVILAPLARIAVNASCPGVSINVICLPFIFTTEAPIACVIPPASRSATPVFLIASRSEVLP